MSLDLFRQDRWRRGFDRVRQQARPRALAGRLQAAARWRRGGPASPLLIALLAAIALHLLALAGLQLRQRRQPAALVPPPRDDTPELLRFSRQQTREPALAPLSIAALAQLPLPPPPPLAATSADATAAAATPRKAGSGSGSSDLSRLQPAASRANRPRAGANRAADRRPAAGRPATSTAAKTDPGLESALASLGRLQAGAGQRPVTTGEQGWPAPQKAETEQLSLWRRLWEKATPAAAAATGPRPLPAGVELRRLSAADSTAAELPGGRRLSLQLNDRLLLVWPVGRELWLLQAPATRPAAADDEESGSGG